MSSNQFHEQAKQHAVKAIEFDQTGQIESAIFYYLVIPINAKYNNKFILNIY